MAIALKDPPAVASASGAHGAEWRGSIRLVILGQPVSMKNRRELVWHKGAGRPMLIKSKKALAYAATVAMQVPVREPLLTGKLKLTALLVYESERPDLDDALILDCLEKRIYVNDRQIRERHIYHATDKHNPRAEVVIEPLQAELLL